MLFAATAASALAAYGVCRADTADTTSATDSTSSASVQELVVTAERREETVENVPMTVQAIPGLALQNLNVTTLDSLLKYTPNVTFGNNGPGQGNIFMRGLSAGFAGDQSSATAGNFPNVAVYLDEQSMQFPMRNVDIYMADMDRVEVLEGPQGTLFGGGAEAGAVRYITNKPKLDHFEGQRRASYGFTDGGDPNSSANAMLNVPLVTDKLAVRLVIYDERQGGYIDNVPSTFTRSNADLGNSYWNIMPTGGLCPNHLAPGPTGICAPPNSGQINNYAIAEKAQNPMTYTGARFEALYQINDDWNVLITESLQNLDAEGLSVEYPTGSDFQPLAPLQVTSFNPAYDKDKFENTAWTVNGKIGDLKAVYTGGYMVRNISQQMEYSNYSRSKGGMYYQCTGGTTGWGGQPFCYSPSGYWQDTVRNTHFSNEARISTPDDWRWRAHRRRLLRAIPHLRRPELQLQNPPGLHAGQPGRRPDAGRPALRRRCGNGAGLDRHRSRLPRQLHGLRRGRPARLRSDGAVRLRGLRHHPQGPDGDRRDPLVRLQRVRDRLAVRDHHQLHGCALTAPSAGIWSTSTPPTTTRPTPASRAARTSPGT